MVLLGADFTVSVPRNRKFPELVKLEMVKLEPARLKLEPAKIVAVEAVIWPAAVKDPPSGGLGSLDAFGHRGSS